MDLHNLLDMALPRARETAERTDAEARFPTEAVAALSDAGLLGVGVADEHGGIGGGPTETVGAVGAAASACGSTAMVYLMHLMGVDRPV